MMIEKAGIKNVERIKASHTPFQSMPKQVAAFVRRAAEEQSV